MFEEPIFKQRSGIQQVKAIYQSVDGHVIKQESDAYLSHGQNRKT